MASKKTYKMEDLAAMAEEAGRQLEAQQSGAQQVDQNAAVARVGQPGVADNTMTFEKLLEGTGKTLAPQPSADDKAMRNAQAIAAREANQAYVRQLIQNNIATVQDTGALRRASSDPALDPKSYNDLQRFTPNKTQLQFDVYNAAGDVELTPHRQKLLAKELGIDEASMERLTQLAKLIAQERAKKAGGK